MTNLNEIVKNLEEDKVIESLAEYAYILKMIKDIWLNDEVIKDIGSLIDSILTLVPILQKLSQFLSDPTVSKVIETITSEEAIKIIQNPEKMSLGKLILEFRNENFQRGLGIIIKLIEKIGEISKG
ncbi:MAG: DUF1641 domain-containing protein [Saccharolobus sp.]|jgi:uncharacterized protein YjgD (DUF1641 family)|uniref:DUF1641 domain-containing protein n=1 Tax=Saccharolobus sp. TaxID=2100761 RepID=UPI0028CE6F75|nr:DUF1641 domain-containing protein [Saccharolobus sp.]MDT7861954.1 DUF1641 domain-containing protein [Saccharolobus sp.]